MCFALTIALAAVSLPRFDISDYGARGDGVKCTEAIARAISACETSGGGRVVVPKGEWQTGAVRLKSNVELHLEEGAVLLFSDELADYLPGVPVSWEGIECVNVSPLVYAYACTNVAITGRGTLKAKMDFWWTWTGDPGPEMLAAVRTLKNEWSPKNVPVEKRQLWRLPNARFRPQFLHFNRCKGVRLEGFAIRGTPFWTVHLLLCDGVVASDLDVNATGDDGRMINNSDGIDIDGSRNVLIERCRFCQGDDAIVFKSGKDFDGRRLAHPTENVTVRDCVVYKGHNLAAIGSELSGGVRNIRISRCRIEGKVGRVLHVKTNPRRGGFVEDIAIEDVVTSDLASDVLGITSRYFFGGPGEEAFERDYFTPIRRVTLRNVSCGRVPRLMTLRGDYLVPVEDVTVENVTATECLMSDYVASVRNFRKDGAVQTPTVEVLAVEKLGVADVSNAIYVPETREYALALTDGTVAGTIVRVSRDKMLWSEPYTELWAEPERTKERVCGVKLRREPNGWYLDVKYASDAVSYFTPELFWPFKPQSDFEELQK